MDNIKIPYEISYIFSICENVAELRLMSWIIAKAACVMKNYDAKLKEINIQHSIGVSRMTLPAKYLIAKTSHNYKEAYKAAGLAKKTILYDDGVMHKECNIITFPHWYHDADEIKFTCVIHSDLWRVFCNFTKGWRIVQPLVFLALRTPAACALYIMLSRQNRPITLSMATLREVCGVAKKKSYTDTNAFIRRVIDPARAELTKAAPTTFEYTMNREGRGGRYATITLIPTPNTPRTDMSAYTKEQQLQNQMRVTLDERVTNFLCFNCGFEAHNLTEFEQNLHTIGDWQAQIDWLSRAREQAQRHKAGNVQGYIVEMLRRRRG